MNAIGSIVSYINGFDKDKEATLMYSLCIKDLISEVCKIKEVNHPGFTIRRATGHRTYFGYSKYLCYDAR